MVDNLQFDLCEKCGEIHPEGVGIWAMMTNPCHSNQVTYQIMGGRKMIQAISNMMALQYGTEEYEDDVQTLKDLLVFPHFKKMENFETASWLERNNYSLMREYEVKQMKRLKAFIKLEDTFSYKY
jgi:hypothetical protein